MTNITRITSLGRSPLALAAMRFSRQPQSVAVVFGLIVGGAAVSLMVWWLVRRLGARLPAGGAFRPSFERLGRHAPEADCPCGRTGAEGDQLVYGACCRPRDVESLQKDVQEYLFRVWCRRSYAGRRSSRSMQQRLADYPMPPVVLPPWVREPERFQFPIEEDNLRAWNPMRPDGLTGDGGIESTTGELDDLPF